MRLCPEFSHEIEGTMPDHREQAIRERAYAIWEQEDRPDGKDLDHWLRAEAEISSAGYARDKMPRVSQIAQLPIRDKPMRFAVGAPDGLTSNSWKIRATKSGIYIACRDNFKETKVSLHAKGRGAKARWRMGFTTESLPKMGHLLSEDENRAWEVWDEPPPSLPGTVVAFRLVFPTSELAVRPEQRMQKEWKKNVIYIENGPPGKMTVLTLFVTSGEPDLAHQSEPSLRLASFDIGGRRAQLIAHGEPENAFQDLIRRTVAQTIVQVQSAGIDLPDQAYGYFLGRQANGCR